MQGAPGVGKTTLARLLALELDGDYPDGVIWEDLGPDFTAAEQAQAVLRRWAGHATSFFDLGENLNKLFTFEPAAVRSLLAEHPALLVVLDNVWSLAAIRPLRDALPRGSRLIVTTRSREIAQGLGAGWVEVGLLTDAEALDLFDLRLHWRPQQDRPADGWAFGLAGGVGMHALGLDVALGVLRRYGDAPAEWQPVAERLLGEVGSGRFDRLRLGDDDPGHNVKAVMMFSYEALREEARVRFRRLGAFAAEADFTTDAAAATWGCDLEAAFETLTDFAVAALLARGGGVWRQHSLLRAFALALLRDAGGTDAAAAAHARAYAEAMRRAEDAQHYYEMLPALPQLRHAFEWALANDLDLALDIATHCANLQNQFGLAREGGEWSERVLAVAQSRATPEILARAWGHRGNLLGEMAGLPGEDRRARLLAALTAYDAALQHYRPDTTPLDYAATQNNRASLLSEMAGLPGEDRHGRLLAALSAYDAALQFRRPDTAPLDHAATQNNRATLLIELAGLPGEDRHDRLLEALAANDEALRYYRPDTTPLDYAATQNNRAPLLSELAELPGEDRHGRLLEALAANDEALRYYWPDTTPLAYAMTQNNRATLLSEIAGLPGEDRRGRLLAALAAYDEALQHYRPDTVPLNHAATQNNREILLREIGELPGEDRRRRLLEALAANDEALRFRRPDTAPLAYAMTQHNRANLLGEIAKLPGEGRRGRLLAALAACDAALQHHRPDTAPLAYAATQNSRGVLLVEIAMLPGEDRRARLLVALAAYDEALKFQRPDTVPLDYAMTQNNLGFLLSEIATLPGEDCRSRLLEALAAGNAALQYLRPNTAPLDYARAQGNLFYVFCSLAELPGENRRDWLPKALHAGWEAYTGFERSQHAQYREHAAWQLRRLRTLCGNAFIGMWAAAGLGAPPGWLMQDAGASTMELLIAFAAIKSGEEMIDFWRGVPTELEEPFLQAIEDFIIYTQQAGNNDVVEWVQVWLAAFRQMQDDGTNSMDVFAAFTAIKSGEEMIEFWRGVPAELEEPFMQAVEGVIAQAQQADASDAVQALQSRLDVFRQIRALAQQQSR